MTKVKEPVNRGVMVIESGSPNHSEIYIDGEGYDITTLAHKYGKNPHLSTSGSVAEDMQSAAKSGYNYYSSANNVNSIYGNNWAHSLAVSKYTAYAQQRAATGNSAAATVVPHNFMMMDPNGPMGSIKRFTNSDGDERIIWIKSSWPWNWYYTTSWYNTGSTEFSETYAQYYGGYAGTTGTNAYVDAPLIPVCVDPSGDWIAFITSYPGWEDARNDRPMHGLGRAGMASYDNITYSIARADNYHYQYIGKSDVDGEPIFFMNYRHTDIQQVIRKYDVSANTTSNLLSITTSPSAAGTSYGGTRGNVNIGDLPKYASQTFQDFTSGADSADIGFYVPYFDTNYDYHPFYFQWDKSADTFTRNSDITISGTKSSTYFTSITGAAGDNSGHRTVIYNDTIVSGGTRYLTLYAFSGQVALHDATSTARTFVTYSCGASDPKTLTHHSTVTVPRTPLNMVYLKDDKTIMGIICNNAFYVYTWDNTNGWELTQTITENFCAVGRDRTDRIWAIGQQTSGQYMDAHVLSLDVPTKVTVTPASSSYNYTGTTINTSVGVSAFNISNERVAKNVKLTIDGTSMQFDSDGNGNAGSDSATITTLTNADVTKNVNIVSAGLSDIIANIEL